MSYKEKQTVKFNSSQSKEDVDNEILDDNEVENQDEMKESNDVEDDKNKEKETYKEEKKADKKVEEEAEMKVKEDLNDDEDIEEIEEEVLEEINQLEKEIESLEEEKDNYYQQLVRLKADFSNYRKRTKKEKERLDLEARSSLINELLPVIDNFERALKTADAEGEFKNGIEMIYNQLMEILKQEGLDTIDTVGEPFDHEYHEAIMQVEDTEEDSGIIVEEIQKGYVLNDKVVRPAMVKVAK